MKIGPFFFVEPPINNIRGLYADLMSLEQGESDGDFINHPLSHADLFDRISTDMEYMFVPRGRVLFDIRNNVAKIYLNPTLEELLPEIVKLFELGTNYVIDHEDHYMIGEVAEEEWE